MAAATGDGAKCAGSVRDPWAKSALRVWVVMERRTAKSRSNQSAHLQGGVMLVGTCSGVRHGVGWSGWVDRGGVKGVGRGGMLVGRLG